MEQTTQSPPNNAEKPAAERPASSIKPLPATEEDFHSRPSRTQSSGFRIGVVIAIIILLIAGFFAYRYFTSYESTDDAQVDGHVNSVSARISGHVIKLNVQDNQYVEAGTVLVEIDPADYQVAYERAKADFEDAQAAAIAAGVTVPIESVNTSSQVSASEADVNSARAGIQVARQQFEAAKAELQQAEANNVKAQNDLIRYKQLVDKQEISQQLYDQAVAAAKANSAAVASAHASATAAEQQVTQARSRLANADANYRNAQTGPRQVASTRARALSADATVQQKQAAVEQAQLNLQYTKITAPVNGVVSKNAEVGMNVQPGQQLFAIVPLDEVWVTANYKETQLKYMRPGQPAEIKVDANGPTYQGHVDSIAGSSGARTSLLPPENATGNYVKVVQRIPVKIVLDKGQNSDHYLRLGMSVEPKVKVK